LNSDQADSKLAFVLKLIPNILTFARLALTVIFLVMLLYCPKVPAPNRSLFLDVAFAVFVIAGVTDLVDGPIARRLNVTSKFGRMMDPLADKVLVCGAFVCFAIIGEPKLFNLPEVTLKAILWLVAAVILAREIFVTTLRHIAEARGVDFPATVSGKIKMFLQSFAVGTVLIKAAYVQTAYWGYWFTTGVFVLMLTVTVISGLMATHRTSWKRVKG